MEPNHESLLQQLQVWQNRWYRMKEKAKKWHSTNQELQEALTDSQKTNRIVVKKLQHAHRRLQATMVENMTLKNNPAEGAVQNEMLHEERQEAVEMLKESNGLVAQLRASLDSAHQEYNRLKTVCATEKSALEKHAVTMAEQSRSTHRKLCGLRTAHTKLAESYSQQITDHAAEKSAFLAEIRDLKLQVSQTRQAKMTPLTQETEVREYSVKELQRRASTLKDDRLASKQRTIQPPDAGTHVEELLKVTTMDAHEAWSDRRNVAGLTNVKATANKMNHQRSATGRHPNKSSVATISARQQSEGELERDPNSEDDCLVPQPVTIFCSTEERPHESRTPTSSINEKGDEDNPTGSSSPSARVVNDLLRRVSPAQCNDNKRKGEDVPWWRKRFKTKHGDLEVSEDDLVSWITEAKDAAHLEVTVAQPETPFYPVERPQQTVNITEPTPPGSVNEKDSVTNRAAKRQDILSWWDNYERLKRFKREHGHLNATDDDLVSWIQEQRTQIRVARDPRVEILNKIGFQWNESSIVGQDQN